MTRQQKIEIALSFVVIFICYGLFFHYIGNRATLHTVQPAPCDE